MGIFRNFPYSNFHELNLDDIIKNIKVLNVEFKALENKFENLIIETHNYIRAYLENIHIPSKTSELVNDSDFITSADLPHVNNGTLYIQRNGVEIAKFKANQRGDVTANIHVPPVNNGRLTIQQNGTTVKSFTANQSEDENVNILVPVALSELSNDMNFIDGKPTVQLVANGVPTIISGTNFNGGYYIMGNIVIIQISGTVTGTFSINDYFTIASGLPTSDTPIALNVTSEDNAICNAEAIKNSNGTIVLKSGSVALTGKTITINGTYIKN